MYLITFFATDLTARRPPTRGFEHGVAARLKKPESESWMYKVRMMMMLRMSNSF
jgi:hypothetical protein